MFPVAAAISKGKGFSWYKENYDKTENVFELAESSLVISSPEHECFWSCTFPSILCNTPTKCESEECEEDRQRTVGQKIHLLRKGKTCMIFISSALFPKARELY